MTLPRRRSLATRYRPHYDDSFFRRLLAAGPFERRRRGGWRFGAKLISEAVVFRLVANHHAEIRGDHVHPLVPAVTAEVPPCSP